MELRFSSVLARSSQLRRELFRGAGLGGWDMLCNLWEICGFTKAGIAKEMALRGDYSDF